MLKLRNMCSGSSLQAEARAARILMESEFKFTGRKISGLRCQRNYAVRHFPGEQLPASGIQSQIPARRIRHALSRCKEQYVKARCSLPRIFEAMIFFGRIR